MTKYKQMPASFYKVIRQDDHEAIVSCSYLCPYCMQETYGQIPIQPDWFYLLDDIFTDYLVCDHCLNKTLVRFLQSTRIR